MRNNLAVILVAVALFSACQDETPKNNAGASCETSNECPAAQICRQGLCGVRETEPRRLGFTLEPPTDSAFPPQTISEGAFNIDEPLQILLNAGVKVEGTINFANQPAIGPTGSLTFENLDSSTRKFQARVEQPEGYSATLPAGRYRATFVPDDAEIPSKVWSEIELLRNTDPKFTIPSSYTQVSGSLSRVDAVSRETELIEGATVFAVSRETGSTSTTAITSEGGFFSFSVLPNSGGYDLRVVPSTERPFVPNVTFDNVFETDAEGWTPTEPEGDLLVLSLGSYTIPSSTLAFTVRSVDVDDWSGTRASVRLEAGAGTIEYGVPVEMDGTFNLPFFEAAGIAVTILPVSESPASRFDFEGALGDLPSQIEIPSKHRFEGTIENWDAERVMSATIEATPVEGEVEEITTTTTDAEGKFTLWLEKKDYVVTVTPQDAALPIATVTLSGKEDEMSSDTIVVAEPTVLWGSVFATVDDTETLEAVADVVVRAFETIDGVTSRIGSGTTNEDGAFKLIVPAR